MSSFCPLTLDPVPGKVVFSEVGLRKLHPRLKFLQALELSHEEQLRQARLRADKMSIQGVQPKLSAILLPGEGRFKIVDAGGRFLLKPNPPPYEEVPANEALTMTMAEAAGIDVPAHGLIPAIDGSWIYVIRRFDREGRDRRLHVEDFAQLSGATRDTKYDSSLERVVRVVEEHCTFPVLEKSKLARRLLFCFLTGNEDMHLKNFSLMVRESQVSLSPAYDLLNTSLVLENPREESALPLNGKKRNMTRALWLDYFCRDRLGMSPGILDGLLADIRNAIPRWRILIGRSYLSEPRRKDYLALVQERLRRLEIAEPIIG